MVPVICDLTPGAIAIPGKQRTGALASQRPSAGSSRARRPHNKPAPEAPSPAPEHPLETPVQNNLQHRFLYFTAARCIAARTSEHLLPSLGVTVVQSSLAELEPHVAKSVHVWQTSTLSTANHGLRPTRIWPISAR